MKEKNKDKKSFSLTEKQRFVLGKCKFPLFLLFASMIPNLIRALLHLSFFMMRFLNFEMSDSVSIPASQSELGGIGLFLQNQLCLWLVSVSFIWLGSILTAVIVTYLRGGKEMSVKEYKEEVNLNFVLFLIFLCISGGFGFFSM